MTIYEFLRRFVRSFLSFGIKTIVVVTAFPWAIPAIIQTYAVNNFTGKN
jgi:hypothetical protein